MMTVDPADAFQAVILIALAHFAGTGARAVVAERVPDATRLVGWQRIGETSYYLYRLDPLPMRDRRRLPPNTPPKGETDGREHSEP